jgi:hypothetical protein
MSRSYAIVGLGHRAYTFLHALLGAHAADGRLVGLCDDKSGQACACCRRRRKF